MKNLFLQSLVLSCLLFGVAALMDQVLAKKCSVKTSEPVEIQAPLCRSPPHINIRVSHKNIQLIHQKETSEVRAHLCRVRSTIRHYLCMACVSSKHHKCLKLLKTDFQNIKITREQCLELAIYKTFSHKFKYFGLELPESFHNIIKGNTYSRILIGKKTNNLNCQGYRGLGQSQVPIGTVLEIDLTFEFEAVDLKWFPQQQILTFLGQKLRSDNTGSAETNVGIIAFDPKDTACNKAYSYKSFKYLKQILMADNEFFVLEQNDLEIIEIKMKKTFWNSCLKSNLTEIDARGLFVCSSCNNVEEKLSPEVDILITENYLRIRSLDNLQSELTHHRIDQIRYEICETHKVLSTIHPELALSGIKQQSTGTEIVQKNGLLYLSRCKFLTANVATELEQCYNLLPVRINGELHFLNDEGRIVEQPAAEVPCPEVSKLQYRALTTGRNPIYLCNPPNFSHCSGTFSTLQPKKNGKTLRFQLGHIFSTQDFKAKIRKLTIEASLRQEDLILPNNFITPAKNRPPLEENFEQLNFNNFYSFLKTELKYFSISGVLSLNYWAFLTLIILERIMFHARYGDISLFKILSIVIFLCIPIVYLFYIILVQRKPEKNKNTRANIGNRLYATANENLPTDI